jgi:hypothetical protein
MPGPALPFANAKYRKAQASMAISMMILISSPRSRNGSRSMKPTSDICPKV